MSENGRIGEQIKSFCLNIDVHLWVILAVGLLVLVAKCTIVYPVEHVGESDASGYAEMADSLRQGKWLSVEYISFFFIKYSGMPRPEDHWPPLYSFLIAPFYVLLGKTAFASKLPSLIISSLFLPAATYLLTRHFSKNKWADRCRIHRNVLSEPVHVVPVFPVRHHLFFYGLFNGSFCR